MGVGADLAEAFYLDFVEPIIERHAPGVGHLAGRLGSGSDVLSFEDDRSADHDFGCRLTVLVDEVDAVLVPMLDDVLEAELPREFRGWLVRFPTTWDPRNRHKVEVATVYGFAKSRLGVDANVDLDLVGWLSLTGQSVLEVTGGRLFHDETQEFGRLARRLEWYPTDVWLYVLASCWTRLSQELPFVGRTAERGDEVGSRVIASRLARDVIHLAFLLERRWPPYPKWVGSALTGLPTGAVTAGQLQRAAAAGRWQQREEALCNAIDELGRRQRALGLPVVAPVTQPFFDRPFRVTNPAMVTSLMNEIVDPAVRRLPVGIGSVEQWCDNVDLLTHPERRPAVQALYWRLFDGDARKARARALSSVAPQPIGIGTYDRSVVHGGSRPAQR